MSCINQSQYFLYKLCGNQLCDFMAFRLKLIDLNDFQVVLRNIFFFDRGVEGFCTINIVEQVVMIFRVVFVFHISKPYFSVFFWIKETVLPHKIFRKKNTVEEFRTNVGWGFLLYLTTKKDASLGVSTFGQKYNSLGHEK